MKRPSGRRVPVPGVHASLRAFPSLGSRASLADEVHGILLDAITGGTLEPGERLREIPLAKQFGVSTTPIREALRRLEREGLIRLHANRGAVVAAYDAREIMDLYEVREVLEARAVCRAALAPERDLSQVDALLARMESVRDDPDQVEFNNLDVAFHRALNEAGGNWQIAEHAERIQRQIQGIRVRASIHLAGRPRVSHVEHLAIVDAVRTGDGERAEALLRAHIFSIRDAILRVLDPAPPHGNGSP